METPKLFQVVALDPALVRVHQFLKTLKYKFGLSNGRVIAQVPRDWMSFALSEINKLDDELEKKRLKTTLQSLNQVGALVIKDSSFNRSHPWLTNALRELDRGGVDILIATEPLQREFTYSGQEIDDYIEQSDRYVGYVDVSAFRRSKQYIQQLEPFLQSHRKIVLINRHQWLMTSRKENELFRELFSFWASVGGHDFTVVRTCVVKKGEENGFSDRWIEETQMIRDFFAELKYQGTFRFFAVNDNDKENRLHHRYLLGQYCGISLDYGLEMGDKPHPWQLMIQAHFMDAREKFYADDLQNIYPECKMFSYSCGGKRIVIA